MTTPRSRLDLTLVACAALPLGLLVGAAVVQFTLRPGLEAWLLLLAPWVALVCVRVGLRLRAGAGADWAQAAAGLGLSAILLPALATYPCPPDLWIGAGLLVGGVLGGGGLLRWSPPPLVLHGLALAAAAAGGLSLTLTCSSPATALRDAAPGDGQQRPALTLEDPAWRRDPGEDALAFGRRINTLVHRSVAHVDEGARVRCSDSWILWATGQVPGARDMRALYSARMILRRRAGWCTQSAVVFVQVMRAEGLEADLLGLTGHVVAALKHDAQLYLFDPDIGVGGILYPGQGPAPEFEGQLRTAYRTVWSDLPEDQAATIAETYVELAATREDNTLGGSYDVIAVVGGAQDRVLLYQHLLSWLLLLLIAPGLEAWAWRRPAASSPTG